MSLLGVPVDQLVAQQQEDNTAQLLAAALQEEADDLRFSRPQQSNDALESLLATAARVRKKWCF